MVDRKVTCGTFGRGWPFWDGCFKFEGTHSMRTDLKWLFLAKINNKQTFNTCWPQYGIDKLIVWVLWLRCQDLIRYLVLIGHRYLSHVWCVVCGRVQEMLIFLVLRASKFSVLHNMAIVGTIPMQIVSFQALWQISSAITSTMERTNLHLAHQMCLKIAPLRVLRGRVCTRVQVQRNSKTEWSSYWLRENWRTKGVYIRVRVQGMRKINPSNNNVAWLSRHISAVVTEEEYSSWFERRTIFKVGSNLESII